MDRPLPRILSKIRDTKLAEIEALLVRKDMPALKTAANARLAKDQPRDFEGEVSRSEGLPRVIAEVKKASPSKGIIRADFNPQEIAGAYRRGGAAAISCLTDEVYFQGHLDYLPIVREESCLPVLRKDFILHPAQVYEACEYGADAVLLIARMLDQSTLNDLYRLAKELGLGVLLEVHDEPDLERALAVGATLLGVNNRDLDTFVVDFETVYRLREMIPGEIPVVAESGISSSQEMKRLAEANIQAVLVGESLMRQDDVELALRSLQTA